MIDAHPFVLWVLVFIWLLVFNVAEYRYSPPEVLKNSIKIQNDKLDVYRWGTHNMHARVLPILEATVNGMS